MDEKWKLDDAALIAALLDCRKADEVVDLITNYADEFADLARRLGGDE